MNDAIMTLSDADLDQIEGGWIVALLEGVALAAGLAYVAYDIYQGWSNYQPSTPDVHSTITYQ